MNKDKCFMCNKKIKKGRFYCYDHYQEYLAAKSEQTYSASDDKDPWEYDND